MISLPNMCAQHVDMPLIYQDIDETNVIDEI